MYEWRVVESKGETLLISSGGLVKVPAHESKYERDGVQVSAKFPERILAPYLTRNGYLEIRTCVDGRRAKHLLHRLVGFAFVPGYSEGLTINHIDGNKTNNDPKNLEWVSLARNTEHQWETGLVDLRGENAPGHKLTSKRVVYIRQLLAQGVSAHTLAIVAGVSPSLIDKIKNGTAWAHV